MDVEADQPEVIGVKSEGEILKTGGLNLFVCFCKDVSLYKIPNNVLRR